MWKIVKVIGPMALCATLCQPPFSTLAQEPPMTPAELAEHVRGIKDDEEPSLQEIFDLLGYGYLDAALDETGMELFPPMPGTHWEVLYEEQAGYAPFTSSGWYPRGSPEEMHVVFTGESGPGDTAAFVITGDKAFGLYLNPEEMEFLWYSEARLNSDGMDHCWVYRTRNPGEYIVAWEDRPPEITDYDYQDLVVVFRQPPTPVIQAEVSVEPKDFCLATDYLLRCYIELPLWYGILDNTVVLSGPHGEIRPVPQPRGYENYDLDTLPDLMVAFDLGEAVSIVEPADVMVLKATGRALWRQPPTFEAIFEGYDTITVKHCGFVSGLVHDAVTGEPLSGARVEAVRCQGDQDNGSPGVAKAQTNEEGFYRISWLVPGVYGLRLVSELGTLWRGGVEVQAGATARVDFEVGSVSVGEGNELPVPREYALFQNRPNPFNAETEIGYALPQRCRVTLEVYDLLGHTVATLVDGEEGAGQRLVRWNAGSLPSGIYFCRLEAGGYEHTMRLILLK